MPRRLVLVRHGNPEVSPDTAVARWRLSQQGIERSRQLARRLQPLAAPKIFSSIERKAVETARVMGEVLDVPIEVIPGVHEHERPSTPMIEKSAFEALMQQFFLSPSESVFGSETADRAASRFAEAIKPLTAQAFDDVVVVTHGTVMTLFVARATGVEQYSFWRDLSMPCAVTLGLPGLELHSITNPD